MIISPALARACKAADITLTQLREQDKRREIAHKRFQVYHHLLIAERVLYPNRPPMSQPICGRLCHRDHTTILYGARQHSAKLYGTRPEALTDEMVAAYETHRAHIGAIWAVQWLEGYGEFEIPQGAVEIVEDAA